MISRHTSADVNTWIQQGFVVIPDFFNKEEITPVLEDFKQLYTGQGNPDSNSTELNTKTGEQIGGFHPKQFLHFDTLPYAASEATNLLSLHPALIDFSKDLLGAEQVHLYQSHTWAKYTGEADYDQPFHCDFGNHTLTVPGDNPIHRTVDFIVYITDVTDELGALRYVTKPDSAEVIGDQQLVAQAELQSQLKQRERSAAGPAGTLVAHSIDTFHRGSNLTAENGFRFTMTMGYKAAGNDMIGFHVWQEAPNRPWAKILDNATPEQLQCLGIPLPGDAFWTPRTVKLTQARWPDWNMQAYAEKLAK
ncbi:MAG: hypothetical protein HOL98_03875 [Gammaproteobacteria bacterium]|nr:hypothetical protein [Gammaproteobacteria bacterium]MBT5202575.1 hypothetical protein [Gammaproteobacteria bacterium]MBT5602453.1 hypothetical protein [Gammaproteobacteria bacterium]MBT6243777.1 hypothetical protein [Gammaproteobacteria bacterium]